MRNCSTYDLYEAFSKDVRNVVGSDEAKSLRFKEVFPEIELHPFNKGVKRWALTSSKRFAYFGNGVGGNILGLGADIVAIIDDAYTGLIDALSPKVQEDTVKWKESDHDSRKEKDCPEILIGTRWTTKDLIGVASDRGTLDIEIKIAALDEKGETFCEDVKTTEQYQAIKADTDEDIWNAEYQQEPAELKGLLFPASELKYFRKADLEGRKADYKHAAIDPADLGDNTAMPTGDLYEDKIFITEALYNNDGTDITLPRISDIIVDGKYNSVEIEGVSAWILFGKDIRSNVQKRYRNCDIRIIKNTANKGVRILAESAWIKNHCVFLHPDDQGKEYKAFMKCLTAYMKDGSTTKDDAPDSLAMLSTFYRKHFVKLWN
jgi:predicted phage terminase large subunit-like protein